MSATDACASRYSAAARASGEFGKLESRLGFALIFGRPPVEFEGFRVTTFPEREASERASERAESMAGTGSEKETGVGNIFNAPIQSGTSSDDFINIFEGKILENIDKFKPEVILVSAGFDAHKRDPLANINLESEDYYTLTKSIVEIANLHCDGRVISFLEGGYDLLALSEGTKAHLKGLNEN